MAVRRPPPRRVLADGLGPDADDPAGRRPGAPRDRRLEHRVPPGGAGGRRLAGDVRGRRGRDRPARGGRAGRRAPRGDVRALRRRAPRALARRTPSASGRRGRRGPARPAGRGGLAGRRVRPRARVAGRPRRWRGRRAAGRVSRRRRPVRAASPAALAPLGVPQLLVHGTDDDIVPISQSRDHAARDPSRSSSSSTAPTISTWSTSTTPPGAR